MRWVDFGENPVDGKVFNMLVICLRTRSFEPAMMKLS